MDAESDRTDADRQWLPGVHASGFDPSLSDQTQQHTALRSNHETGTDHSRPQLSVRFNSHLFDETSTASGLVLVALPKRLTF
jgi:hypothetical protein